MGRDTNRIFRNLEGVMGRSGQRETPVMGVVRRSIIQYEETLS